MKFFGFHLMPYQDLPQDHLDGTESSWVTLSNAVFDPRKGHLLYQRYIDELVAFDRAGFDGLCVNEQGSGETIDWAARNRYTYLQTYNDIATVRRVFDEYRATAQRYGYTASPEQVGWAIPVYVADTDEQAEAVALSALDYLFNRLMRMPKDVFFPAGYLTLASSTRVMAGKGGLGSGHADVRDLVQRGYALIGSPDTVRQQFEAYQKELGFGCFCGVFQFGSLDHEHFLNSLQLFARKVMPAIRELGA